MIATLWAAAAPAQIEIPEPLTPWRDWVLYGQEYRACPLLGGADPASEQSYVCAWPGVLEFDVDTATAEFTQDWTLYTEAWVPLPGSAERFPAEVRVDGAPVAVVLRGGRPTVRLAAGEHAIEGQLTWSARPASIPIPPEAALVELTLDGETIASPRIEGDALWFGLRDDAAVDEDRLNVVVYRLLSDTLPLRLETRIELDVAGQSREIELDGALLEGFVGEALESELAVRLEPDGSLRAQVRPGRWQLRLIAHRDAVEETLAMPDTQAPWPAEEIWSFETVPRLRVAALEGAPAVDAERTGVPREWQRLPSYRVGGGQTLTLAERSRNDAAERNRLALTRNLWLDFDGGGFTSQDFVRGQMRSGWRLDMAGPYTMTMASIDDEGLLITEGLEPGAQGIELRAPELELVGTSRVAREARLPVSGYLDVFERVDTTLHLPPGRRLVAAPGADTAAGAWLDSWRLLDIFLALIVSVAVWRLFGTVPGIVAVFALVLMYHEPWAPRWTWLNLLVAIGLARVAPEGRLRSFAHRYRLVSVALLALMLVPFTVAQLRVVVFPQLEHAALQRGIADARPQNLNELLSLARDGAGTAANSPRLEELRSRAVEEVVVTASRDEPDIARYLPGALVQTGPGLPDWAWTRYSLRFGGPVEAEQSFRLIVLGPWLVALWRVASVALALGLLWLLIGPRLPKTRGAGPPTATAALLSIALAASLSLAPEASRAQAASEFPSPALLGELRERLTRPAACHPACAELMHARVAVNDDTLSLALEFAVEAPVAVPIAAPGAWQPATVTVDGANVALLHRGPDERVWLQLDAGVRSVTVDGAVPAAASVAVPFPMPPRRIEVAAPGFDVAGVADGRLPSGTLELIRQAGDDDAGELPATVFPPHVSLTRHVTFDLDWRVVTEARRVAPSDAAFTLPISLLEGEAVETPGIEVAGGTANVAFAAGQKVVFWESRLPSAAMLTLTAPTDAPWAERWRFTIGQIWHAELDGIPVTAPEPLDPEFYTPEIFPRPGETLTVTLTRPAPAGGDTIAIDEVDYTGTVGQRGSSLALGFTYRSTRGMDHSITLPEGSELEEVVIDGRTVPLRLEGRQLGIPATPGEHDVSIRWRMAAGATLGTSLPRVDLGVGASNLYTALMLPGDRWVLYTFGPTLGPAVLYWAELVVFVLAAFVVGRLPLSPLKTHEWLLLGLGLSTFAWPALLLFAVWAFALSLRARHIGGLSRRWFNAAQVGLGALTIAALGAVLAAIPAGLLGSPDMQIVSPVRFGTLAWFVDRTAGETPNVGVVSVSLWFYKAAMLAWALWLSFALLRWLPWAWRAFSASGVWRGRVAKAGAD